MFIGHYGVAFAAKPVGVRLEARAPLWVWFIASQWMDVVWSFLVLLGIERLRIVPGFTEANALDLYYMPYTHSLPGSIVLSFLFGAIVALLTSGNRAATILLVAAVYFYTGSLISWCIPLICRSMTMQPRSASDCGGMLL